MSSVFKIKLRTFSACWIRMKRFLTLPVIFFLLALGRVFFMFYLPPLFFSYIPLLVCKFYLLFIFNLLFWTYKTLSKVFTLQGYPKHFLDECVRCFFGQDFFPFGQKRKFTFPLLFSREFLPYLVKSMSTHHRPEFLSITTALAILFHRLISLSLQPPHKRKFVHSKTQCFSV